MTSEKAGTFSVNKLLKAHYSMANIKEFHLRKMNILNQLALKQ